jgi:hypothetical protein
MKTPEMPYKFPALGPQNSAPARRAGAENGDNGEGVLKPDEEMFGTLATTSVFPRGA